MAIHPKLMKAIPGMGLVLIAGGVGSGKSCLGYGLLEAFHRKDISRPCFAFNFPEEKEHLLPSYIRTTNSITFPERSIVILDEAYFAFHSKDPHSDINIFMDKLSGMVRQKEMLALFITQTTRKLALAQVSSAQAFLLKMPDVMMVKLDRRELRKILEDGMREFRQLPESDRRESVYMVTTEYEGMLAQANTPPRFWTDELSTAWKDVELSTPSSLDNSPEALAKRLQRAVLQEEYQELDDFARRYPGTLRGLKRFKRLLNED